MTFHDNCYMKPKLYAGLMLALIPWLGCSEDVPPAGPAEMPGATQTTPGATTAGAMAAAPAAGSGTPRAGGAGTIGTSGTAGTAGGATGGVAGAPNTGAAGTSGAPVAGSGMQPTATAGSGMPMAGDGAAGTPGMAPSSEGKLPRVTMVEGAGNEDAVRGPWGPAVKVMDTPPGGWLVYPMDIGKDGVKHPIFIFGPGGGTDPPYYDRMGMHWDHYTSYGFVVYIAPMSSFSSTAALDDGLTWVIEQNDDMSSPLFQKLDTSKVGAAGHSQGSVMVFNFMPDPRVTTTIHISGGSMGGSGGPANLMNDTFFLCGPSSDVAYPNCETDFEISTVPTVYSNILEASHTTSGRYGWGAIVAWLLWHLAGHEEWKKEFLEPDGQFQTGRYTTQTKNW